MSVSKKSLLAIVILVLFSMSSGCSGYNTPQMEFGAQSAPTPDDPTPTREGPTDTPTPTLVPTSTPYEFCGYSQPRVSRIPFRCVTTMTPYVVLGTQRDGWVLIGIPIGELSWYSFWRRP